MPTRFLYEKSVLHDGYLIIPYVDRVVMGGSIYSYRLLSVVGNDAQYHRAENPTQTYAGRVEKIILIAQQHLNENVERCVETDYFQERYVYLDNLIMISAIADKYFYDHYPPDRLQNIAAPKIFPSEQVCIDWVKRGIDRH